jgi:integrase
MPRSAKLSWQAPAEGSGRSGRWRKKYKGKSYYFPGGRGKSDREAYDAAWAAWEILKAQIDRTAPRKHQREYEQAIGQWEAVLAWSNRNGEKDHVDLAEKRLDDLRRRFAAPHLTSLSREDRFESVFDSPIDLRFLDDFKLFEGGNDTPPEVPVVTYTPSQKIIDSLDGSPRRIAREIWHDRLEVQSRKAAPDDESLLGQIKKYLLQKENQAKAGEVSIGRFYALKLHLTYFQDWIGKSIAVKEIDGESLAKYHAHLLEKASSKKWTKTTANHYLTTLKSFVRWLWQTEAIPVLPRILDGSSQFLKITKSLGGIVVFTKEEVKSLLADASDRTKLYILLMLNCGMTQKDIADLLISEVDWKEGRVIRRRSKTADCENVPIVNYKLWPETFRLLQKERRADCKDHVLVNSNGGPLWSEEITAEGKYQKTDNVKNAFDRLRKTVGIKKPLKSFKKTSASLLRGSGNFSSLESLFLGHAPQSMSDKHYAQAPQRLLDQAVDWLRSEFGCN